MADAEEFRSLNVSYPQVVVERPDDPECFYHHRLLLARVSGAVWIAADPDLLLARLDLEEEQHLVVARNALFPDICLQDDTGLLCFDPLSDAQLRRLYREARLQASLLGGDALAEADGQQWLFADHLEGKLGETIPQQVVEDPDRFVALAGHALALVDGSVFRGEVVATSEKDSWQNERRKTVQDQRLLYLDDGLLAADMVVSDYLAKATATVVKHDDWKLPGPLAASDWLAAIAAGPNNLSVYHTEWLRLSGVSSGSAVAHEHRHHVETLRLLKADSFNLLSVKAVEHIVRRTIQLERAVARCPQQPDFTGLDLITNTGVDAKGAARSTAFDEFVLSRQKEEAYVLKQSRLYAEETGKKHSSDDGPPEKAGRAARGRGRNG